MDFVLNNWYLFVALGVILFLLVIGPITQQLHGIKNVNASQTVQLLNREDAVIVDVGETKDYQVAHIPKAINLPLTSLMERIRDIEKYKNKPIIVTCRTGQRSQKGAVILRKQGFATVSILTGGLQGWEKENLPVEKSVS